MSAASYCLLINQMTSYQIARKMPTGILAGSVQIVKQRRAHTVCDVADFCLVILVIDAGRKRCTGLQRSNLLCGKLEAQELPFSDITRPLSCAFRVLE